MTIDEAIKHAEEVAEEKFNNAVYIIDKMKSDVALENAAEYQKCAEEHTQLAEWLKELKQLREQTRWTPCSEGSPDEEEIVLVTDLGSIEFGKLICGLFGDLWLIWLDNCWDEATKVTAWMPLPKPYKAESEDKE